MIYNLYCVKDEKVEFEPYVIPQPNDDLAIHSFGSSLVNTNPSFGRFEDYGLYCLGSIDTATGKLTPCEPRFIIHGLNAREKAITRIKFLNLESEVLENDSNMETES